MSAAPSLFAAVTAEDWLLSRLAALGHPLDPATSALPLKDRVRELITSAGIAPVIAGRRSDGKGAEDFEAVYERVYGSPLIPKPARKPRKASA